MSNKVTDSAAERARAERHRALRVRIDKLLLEALTQSTFAVDSAPNDESRKWLIDMQNSLHDARRRLTNAD